MLATGATNDAVWLCRSKASALNSPVLAEKLGDLSPVNSRAAAYEAALKIAGDSHRYLRIALKLAAAHEANQQPTMALAVYEGLPATPGITTKRFLEKARATAQAAGDTEKAALFQKRLDALLPAPKEKQ